MLIRPSLRIPVLVAVLIAGVPVGLTAQLCEFAEGSRSARQVTLPGGRQLAYLGTPHLVCEDGVEILADSAVAYITENWAQFLGHVRYLDETRELESDLARYFTRQGRLQAEGSLFVRDTVEGSVIRNGDLLYLRKGNNRFEEEMTVTTGADGVRPVMTFVPRPAAADSSQLPSDSAVIGEAPPPPTPFTVVADRLEIRGQSRLEAIGSVEIRRDSVLAFGDSADYERETGSLVLRGNARVFEGAAFDLSARTIEMALAGSELEEIRALREAVLLGRDVRLEAPRIRIHLTQGRMERLVAVHLAASGGSPRTRAPSPADSTAPPRPVATAESYRLTADSIEVSAPGEVLERIFAAGRARSESDARDSLNVQALPAVARHDWVEGDTVIATFAAPDSGAAADTARSRYRLDRLVARGQARSLYRLPPSDSTARPGVDAPAVHYIPQASEIVIVMEGGELDHMEVEGPTRGIHLEPVRAGTAPDTVAGDTTAVSTGRVQGRAPVPAGRGRKPPTFPDLPEEPRRPL